MTEDRDRERRDLSARFEAFNRLYFAGRLPPYRIVVSARLTGTVDASGDCDRGRRRIRLRREAEDAMVGTLVHEMVHAATGGSHGKRFWAEIRRLHAAGAPVLPEDLEEPRRATAHDVRCGIDDAMTDGATLRRAQAFVAHGYGLTRAQLLRRFPRAAKGTGVADAAECERQRRELARFRAARAAP